VNRLALLMLCTSVLAGQSPAQEISPDVLSRIRARIEARYPDNYSMQRALIDDQVEAYKFLQSYAPPSVPVASLRRIRERNQERYPDNYSMQKALLLDQVQS